MNWNVRWDTVKMKCVTCVINDELTSSFQIFNFEYFIKSQRAKYNKNEAERSRAQCLVEREHKSPSFKLLSHCSWCCNENQVERKSQNRNSKVNCQGIHNLDRILRFWFVKLSRERKKWSAKWILWMFSFFWIYVIRFPCVSLTHCL